MPPAPPVPLEAVTWIGALFDIERGIAGEPTLCRLAVRRELSAPLVADLRAWMKTRRAQLSRNAAMAKAIDYIPKRWDGFASFLDDGRNYLTTPRSGRSCRSR